MKSLLIGVFVGGVIVLMVCSCATVPKEPLGPGEVRLLSLDFPSEVRKDSQYVVSIRFEAEGGPEISTVCIQWAGLGSKCTKALDYGNGLLRADVLAPATPGSYKVKAQVYYVRNGKVEQSNIVETPVDVKGEGKMRTF